MHILNGYTVYKTLKVLNSKDILLYDFCTKSACFTHFQQCFKHFKQSFEHAKDKSLYRANIHFYCKVFYIYAPNKTKLKM